MADSLISEVFNPKYSVNTFLLKNKFTHTESRRCFCWVLLLGSLCFYFLLALVSNYSFLFIDPMFQFIYPHQTAFHSIQHILYRLSALRHLKLKRSSKITTICSAWWTAREIALKLVGLNLRSALCRFYIFICIERYTSG